MTTLSAPPRRPRSPTLSASWLFVLLVATGLLAHGCHGADVDHEPTVAVPVEADPGTQKRVGHDALRQG